MGRSCCVLLVVAFLATACSRSETTTFTPVEQFGTESEARSQVGEIVVEPTPTEVDQAEGLAALEGLIVVSGETAITVIQPDGSSVIQFEDDRRGVLPTWSGDGRFIAVSFADATSADIVVIDVQQPTRVRRTPVDSAPFMYAWADSGQHLATLGGASPGTRLGIYDTDFGTPAFSVTANSVYVAWEPGGTDIAAHVDDRLVLVAGTTGEVINEVAMVGSSFLAPDWVPGTRDVLVVSGENGSQKLLRVNVDDSSVLEVTDLGGPAGIEVSPDGEKVAISHFVADVDDGRSAMTEVLSLTTGERTPIADELSTWLEWSPDGERLLVLATLVGEGMWRVLEADGTVIEAATFSPSNAERQAYLGFGDQYVVSANRWSPDGRAFVFAGSVAGVDGVFIQSLDPLTEPRLVARGDLASWSPA